MMGRSAREALMEEQRRRAARKAAKQARWKASAEQLAAVAQLQVYFHTRKSNALRARWLLEVAAQPAAQVKREANAVALRLALAAKAAAACKKKLFYFILNKKTEYSSYN